MIEGVLKTSEYHCLSDPVPLLPRVQFGQEPVELGWDPDQLVKASQKRAMLEFG